MMTDLNKVVKVALIALTMLVGAQGASADDVATVVENTKAPFGFATRSSRTEATAYNITGGGVYTVDAIKTLIGGQTKNKTFVADGKNVIVLTSNGTTSMDATILSAITANDIIVAVIHQLTGIGKQSQLLHTFLFHRPEIFLMGST